MKKFKSSYLKLKHMANLGQHNCKIKGLQLDKDRFFLLLFDTFKSVTFVF